LLTHPHQTLELLYGNIALAKNLERQMLERLIVLVAVLTTMPVAAGEILLDKTMAQPGKIAAASAIAAGRIF